MIFAGGRPELRDTVSGQRATAGKEFYGVQALRAIAALAVVAGHSTDYLREQNGWVPASFGWIHGPAGVDLFFVISGFVMMVSSGRLLERAHPARLFLWRRVIRIVPLYWLLTAVKLLLMLLAPGLSVHARPGAWNVVASFLFLPSRAADGEIRPLIPLGWTLSFEMMFYLIFAWSLARRRLMSWPMISVLLAIAATGLFRTDAWPAWTSLADPIVLEFLLGAGLGIAVIRGRGLGRLPAVLSIVGGVLLLVLASPGSQPWSRLATWGVGAIFAVTGIVALEGAVGRRLPRWLLLLGDASYSIYLVQTFCFPVLHLLLARMAPEMVHARPVAAGVAMLLASLLMTSVAGVLLFRLVERPMTERLRRGFGVARPEPVVP
jgi:peptidoglycan/LPS O-acetylase OafA/YrhL